MNLLHVDSSITGEQSVSRKLSAAVVARLTADYPGLTVIRRDLVAEPLPMLDAATLAGINVAPQPQSAEHREEERVQHAVMREFLAADIVVVGAPMYNFGVPAQLKTWIDYLAVAGKTFKYTAEGPVGLVPGKHVVIASSRGGMYGPGAPAAGFEHQDSYLRTIFGFFGITDIRFVRAEGLAMGPDKAQAAVAGALEEVAHLKLAA